MEDKSNLFVFEKKEVFLIFVFMLIISATAFTFGVRMGMQWQLDKEGVTNADIEEVKLKSQNEEYTDKILDSKAKNKDINEEATKRLVEEIEKAGQGNIDAKKPVENENSGAVNNTTNNETTKAATGDLIDSYDITNAQKPNLETNTDSAVVEKEIPSSDKVTTNLKGKWTIQVGAYKEMNEAQDFAGGFEVRGYSPILNEVKIPGKGTWYRVSIGAFESRKEAKDYIVKEKGLFQSYDYLIQQIE